MNYKIKYLKKGDTFFPKALKDLEDCPDVLFVLGNEKILNDFSIAIIGSRKSSPEGREIAKRISKELSYNHVNVVSGLAIGIDATAHEECIEAKSNTIAVLGNGFFNLYPKQNKNLFERILKSGGTIISEYFPNEYPDKVKFHRRNRLIAGLSQGVVVIEAREKSGSLVTVNYAKEIKRKVFVVPGNVLDKNYERKQ